MSIGIGILESSRSGFEFILDKYPGASVAYSLRKLRTAYTGNCVRIRRSSDNAQQDFGFVNNYVDTTAISTFCGSGNGFIAKWYDQSGNGNYAASATTQQPQIYFLGAFLFRNGKIYIQFSNTQTLQLTPIIKTATQNYSFFITYEKTSATNQTILLNLSASRYMWLDYGQTNQIINDGIQGINITPKNYAINTTYLVNHICDASTVTIYTNNAAWGSRITTSSAMVEVIAFSSGRVGNLIINEFILYENSQAANRTGITTNINKFYTIF